MALSSPNEAVTYLRIIVKVLEDPLLFFFFVFLARKYRKCPNMYAHKNRVFPSIIRINARYTRGNCIKYAVICSVQIALNNGRIIEREKKGGKKKKQEILFPCDTHNIIANVTLTQ